MYTSSHRQYYNWGTAFHRCQGGIDKMDWEGSQSLFMGVSGSFQMWKMPWWARPLKIPTLNPMDLNNYRLILNKNTLGGKGFECVLASQLQEIWYLLSRSNFDWASGHILDRKMLHVTLVGKLRKVCNRENASHHFPFSTIFSAIFRGNFLDWNWDWGMNNLTLVPLLILGQVQEDNARVLWL